jgi:hypothetical protein
MVHGVSAQYREMRDSHVFGMEFAEQMENVGLEAHQGRWPMNQWMSYTIQRRVTAELSVKDLFDKFTQNVASEHVFCVTPKLKRIIGS